MSHQDRIITAICGIIGIAIIGANVLLALLLVPVKEMPGKGHQIIADAIVPTGSLEPEVDEGEIYIITAYCLCVKCCGKWSAEHPSRQGTDYQQLTASGTVPTEGRTAGSDWSVLPPGTVIEIEGVGQRVIEDNGNMTGKKIDLFMESHETARQFGRQELKVWIVEAVTK